MVLSTVINRTIKNNSAFETSHLGNSSEIHAEVVAVSAVPSRFSANQTDEASRDDDTGLRTKFASWLFHFVYVTSLPSTLYLLGAQIENQISREWFFHYIDITYVGILV
jgi:hypothetical protein